MSEALARTILFLLSASLCVAGPAHAADPDRKALLAGEEQVKAVGGKERLEPDLIEVKFRDNLQIRLRSGKPADLKGDALRDAQVRKLLKSVETGGVWMRSHDVPEEELDKLRAEAKQLIKSVQPPDLNTYFRLRLPPDTDADRVAAEFRMLPEVEAVYRVPRPVRMNVPLTEPFRALASSAPPSPALAPDYYSAGAGPYQRYQDAAPAGIDSRFADTLDGARGTNVRICDVEYSFNSAHADLGAATVVGPAGVDPFNDQNHGTAVAGEYGSVANAEGTTGIVHAAVKLFAAANTAAGYNVGAAITTCVANTSVGDIILIEQQTSGPNGNEKYVPSERYKPTYDAIRAAVAAGRVVVEAAGNGSQDLDAPIYSQGNGGHYPFQTANDSGAIIVGAGKSPNHGVDARSAHDFSNYGSTVDLQGWGDGVVTTGYGHLYSAGGVNRYFTNAFSGTSSASPIVAAAAASLQGRNKKAHGFPLSPTSIKSTLRVTGTAQTGSKNIGPLPDLKRALPALTGIRPPPPTNFRTQ